MTRQCDRCGLVRDNFAAYADGQLTEEEKAPIQAGIAQCPSCAEALQAQVSVRRQLQAYHRRHVLPNPPSRIWSQASSSWDRQDGRRVRRMQVQFAFGSACMLLLLFGAVWARLNIPKEFPVNAALRDYAQIKSRTVTPAYATSDPDAAARWLRSRLGADLPPIDLKLSRSLLLGADATSENGRPLGRLLYRTPQGLIGLYISPNGTEFGDIAMKSVEGQGFHFRSDAKSDELYGWAVGRVGFGITTQPSRADAGLLIEAELETSQSAH